MGRRCHRALSPRGADQGSGGSVRDEPHHRDRPRHPRGRSGSNRSIPTVWCGGNGGPWRAEPMGVAGGGAVRRASTPASSPEARGSPTGGSTARAMKPISASWGLRNEGAKGPLELRLLGRALERQRGAAAVRDHLHDLVEVAGAHLALVPRGGVAVLLGRELAPPAAPRTPPCRAPCTRAPARTSRGSARGSRPA